MNTWKFREQPNTAIICNKKIINDGAWIAYVSHDLSDGGWQFHTVDSELLEADAMVVSLKNIVDLDNSVVELADLPLGWHAWREAKTLKWEKALMA
jgi:hypothetical protein